MTNIKSFLAGEKKVLKLERMHRLRKRDSPANQSEAADEFWKLKHQYKGPRARAIATIRHREQCLHES